MTDRFKFRIWDTKSNVYIGSGSIDIRLGIFSTGNLLDAPRFKLEQCTGLKDKNGKLIYEGDIIYPCYEIKWSSLGYVLPNGNNLSLYNGTCEVIGNIHEKESK